MPHSRNPKMTNLDKKISQIVRRTQRNSAEKKEIEEVGSGDGVSDTGQLYTLCEVATGSSALTRVGNYIKALNVQVNAEWNVAGLASDDYNYMRTILAYSPNPHLVKADFPTTLNGRVDKHKALMVLYDRITFRSNNDDEKGPLAHLKIFRKLNGGKGYRITYDGSGATDYSKGMLYLFAISDSSISPHPDIKFRSYVSFTDL